MTALKTTNKQLKTRLLVKISKQIYVLNLTVDLVFNFVTAQLSKFHLIPKALETTIPVLDSVLRLSRALPTLLAILRITVYAQNLTTLVISTPDSTVGTGVVSPSLSY